MSIHESRHPSAAAPVIAKLEYLPKLDSGNLPRPEQTTEESSALDVKQAGARLESQLKNLLELGQVFRAVAGDQRHVFKAHAAEAGVIKTRLHGHHMAGAKLLL